MPRLSRRVVEPVLHEGLPFHVELDATRSSLPEGARLLLEDHLPPDLEALDPPRGEGPSVVRYRVRPSAKGTRAFHEVHVALRDRLGLWETRRRVPLETRLPVLSSLEDLRKGRVLARREPLEASARSAVGLLLRDLEFDTIRDFTPGDRLRDVDWKRVALHQRLLTRTWERELEPTVALVLDAGRTMRTRHGGPSKLEHAATLALEVAEAAAERSYRLGYLAFDEVAVVDELPATRDRGVARQVAQRLANLPGRILARRRLDVGLSGEAPVDDEETDFLGALGALRGAPAAARARTGVAAATQRLLAAAGDDKLLLIVFTDLERLPDPTQQALARVAAAGHKVVAVVLPGSRFHRAQGPPVRVRDLENAYREEQTRRRARSALVARGVRVLELGPESSAAPIVKASGKEARRRGGGRGP